MFVFILIIACLLPNSSIANLKQIPSCDYVIHGATRDEVLEQREICFNRLYQEMKLNACGKSSRFFTVRGYTIDRTHLWRLPAEKITLKYSCKPLYKFQSWDQFDNIIAEKIVQDVIDVSYP